MMLAPLWETHAGNCRLSECDAPGVLECRPGLKRIAPVDSVVQQQPLQKKHVVHSHCGYPTTPNRCNGSDHLRVARISRETRAAGYPAISISNVFRFDDAEAAWLCDRRQWKVFVSWMRCSASAQHEAVHCRSGTATDRHGPGKFSRLARVQAPTSGKPEIGVCSALFAIARRRHA